MVQRILDDTEESIRADERRCLGGLQAVLSDIKATAEDQATLEHCLTQLDDLFSLVIVGEFNSGKSALANALLGCTLLEEGITPTTTRIQVVRHGPGIERTLTETNVDTVTAPLELLRLVSIVDTPGTNVVFREHEAITQNYVPRSDIVLFVTSSDRPFTESERLFLQRLRQWGKKVVFVLNKIDILRTPEDVASIESFVAENARVVLGLRPEVFPVSAREALSAKQSGDSMALAASRFPALESYIVTTLDERERLRLKLLSPLGVARHLVQVYRQKAENRLELLGKDMSSIADIEWKQSLYKEDMRRQFRHRLAEIDNALYEMENRGIGFLDQVMRAGRLTQLADIPQLQAEFNRRVVVGAAASIEQRVNDLVDWLVASELRQRQAVLEYLSQRRLDHSDRIISKISSDPDTDRTHLLEVVGQATGGVVAGYDQHAEVTGLAASLRKAVATTAGIEAGALAFGALLVAIAPTALGDVIGIAVAAAIAAGGLFVLPSRRRQAADQLRGRVAAIRAQLHSGLEAQFDQEVERSLKRINDAIAPYTRFVRAESGYWTTPRDALTSTGRMLSRLQSRVEAL